MLLMLFVYLIWLECPIDFALTLSAQNENNVRVHADGHN